MKPFQLIKAIISQLNLFNPSFQQDLFEGQTKQFGDNDTRKLVTTPKGIKRWMRTGQKKTKPATEILEQFDLFPPTKDQLELLLQDPEVAQQLDDSIPQYEEGMTLEDRIKRYLDEKQKNKEFRDAGERVAGSKKEISAFKKLTMSELLEQADGISAYKLVTKDKVIPPLEAQKMKDEGYPAGVVYMLKKFRDAVTSRPENTDEARKIYVEALPKIFEKLDKCKSFDEIREALRSIFELKDGWGYKAKNGRVKSVYTLSLHLKDFIEEGAPDVTDVFGNSFLRLIARKGKTAQEVWDKAEENKVITPEQAKESFDKENEYIRTGRKNAIASLKDPKNIYFQVKFNGKYYGLHDYSASEIENLKNQRNPKEYEVFYKMMQEKLDQEIEKNYIELSEEEFFSKYPKKKARGEDWSELIQVEKQPDDNGNEENEGGVKRKVEQPKPLSYIKRVNGKQILEEEVQTDRIIEDYGYASVQFGNWVKDKEAKEHVRYFLASTSDLGDALGLDIKKVNELGGIAISFGARGSGRALAHYEPMHKIINLTKRRGDGTVAHEFGHFFDHLLGGAEKGKEKFTGYLTTKTAPDTKVYSGDRHFRFNSWYISNNDSKKNEKQLHNAMSDVMRAIYEGRSEMEVEIPQRTGHRYWSQIKDKAERVQKLKALIDEYFAKEESYDNTIETERKFRDFGDKYTMTEREFQFNNVLAELVATGFWREKIKPTLPPDMQGMRVYPIGKRNENETLRSWLKDYEPIEDAIGYVKSGHWRGGQKKALADLAKHLGLSSIKVKMDVQQSNFLSQAEQLGDYWKRPQELFARAFESYVQDKLETKGMFNNYLVAGNNVDSTDRVYSVETLKKIYPQGDERKRINEAMDGLIKALIEIKPELERQPDLTEKRVDETIELEPIIKAFGQQINIFPKDEAGSIEGQTKQGKGGNLTFRNHRWHLDDEYKNGKDFREEPAEFSQDPNQENMFPEGEVKPPLAQVKEALDRNEEFHKQQQMKGLSDLADNYIRDAESQKPVFLADMDEVAQENGLEKVSDKFGASAVKKKESLMQKFERNLAKGKPEKNKEISDVLRTTMIINSPKQFEQLMKSVESKGYKVWNNDITNLYDNKEAGYKHIAVKLVKGEKDPIVKELLLMRPKMHEAKNGLGHSLYDIEKGIETLYNDVKSEEHKQLIHNAKTIILHYASNYYKQAFLADEADEKGHSADSNLDATTAFPKSTSPFKKPAKSKTSEVPKAVITAIKSRLGKEIWQPIRAKLLASSSGMPSSDANARIASLISDSIVDPLLKIQDSYNGQNHLFRSLNSARNIAEKKSRFNKSRLYSIIK